MTRYIKTKLQKGLFLFLIELYLPVIAQCTINIPKIFEGDHVFHHHHHHHNDVINVYVVLNFG